MTGNGTTFKSRVELFWRWYSDRAPFFFNEIEAGNCVGLQSEVSSQLDHLFPQFSWSFGPGENGEGHSFTLSAAGDCNRQFLTSYWRSMAPQLDGWTFYSTRQPSELNSEMVIGINEFEFNPDNMLIEPTVDLENEKINVRAWDPLFASTDDEDLRYHVLYLWLDEALGETGTQNWLGSIQIVQGLSSASIPVTKLKSYVDYVVGEHRWEYYPPDETYSTYQFPEPGDEFPRADTIAGSTCNMALIAEFLDAEGQMEDMLAGTGAEFWYIEIDPAFFPDGKQVEVRGQIEDALNETLQQHTSGRVFGGAFGVRSAYIDLVIFDGNQSLRIIEQVMNRVGLDGRYRLHPFATE